MQPFKTLTAETMAMSNIPPDPRDHMERHSFRFDCSTEIFPLDEFSVLTERGHRLEALAAGTIAPATAADEHFLHVDRDEAEPVNIDERAWVRLKGRREF